MSGIGTQWGLNRKNVKRNIAVKHFLNNVCKILCVLIRYAANEVFLINTGTPCNTEYTRVQKAMVIKIFFETDHKRRLRIEQCPRRHVIKRTYEEIPDRQIFPEIVFASSRLIVQYKFRGLIFFFLFPNWFGLKVIYFPILLLAHWSWLV